MASVAVRRVSTCRVCWISLQAAVWSARAPLGEYMAVDPRTLSEEQLTAHIHQVLRTKNIWKAVFGTWLLNNAEELQVRAASRAHRSAYRLHGEDFQRQVVELLQSSDPSARVWATEIARQAGVLWSSAGS